MASYLIIPLCHPLDRAGGDRGGGVDSELQCPPTPVQHT